MRAFAIKFSDIAKCPIHSLSPRHYHEDGTCACQYGKGSKKQEKGFQLREALIRLGRAYGVEE